MPDPNFGDHLSELNDIVNGIEEAIEAYNEGQEAADQVEELSEELDDFRDRIESARDDPESLSGEVYTQLIIDMMMVIPKKLPIPKSLLLFLEAAIRVVALLLGAAVDFSVGITRNRFRALAPNGATAQEAQDAAKVAAPTLQGQLSLLLWWTQGMPVGEGPSLGTRIWDQIKAFLGSLTGVFGVAFPSRIGCMSVLLVAFLFLGASIFVGWILLNIGGDDDPALVGSDVPTATSTLTATSTPGAAAPAPTDTPTDTPTEPTDTPTTSTDPTGDEFFCDDQSPASDPAVDIRSVMYLPAGQSAAAAIQVILGQDPTVSFGDFSFAVSATLAGQTGLAETHEGAETIGLLDSNGNVIPGEGKVEVLPEGVNMLFTAPVGSGDIVHIETFHLTEDGERVRCDVATFTIP